LKTKNQIAPPPIPPPRRRRRFDPRIGDPEEAARDHAAAVELLRRIGRREPIPEPEPAPVSEEARREHDEAVAALKRASAEARARAARGPVGRRSKVR